jgi:sugar phosphate isomerase/epimerase
MHPYRMGESLQDTVGALGTLVRHTHWHDAVNARDKVIITPLDQGELPMDDMMKALAKMGYNGYLSGEWFNTMYGNTPHESLAAYMRDMRTLCQRNGVKIAQR